MDDTILFLIFVQSAVSTIEKRECDLLPHSSLSFIRSNCFRIYAREGKVGI